MSAAGQYPGLGNTRSVMVSEQGITHFITETRKWLNVFYNELASTADDGRHRCRQIDGATRRLPTATNETGLLAKSFMGSLPSGEKRPLKKWLGKSISSDIRLVAQLRKLRWAASAIDIVGILRSTIAVPRTAEQGSLATERLACYPTLGRDNRYSVNNSTRSMTSSSFFLPLILSSSSALKRAGERFCCLPKSMWIRSNHGRRARPESREAGTSR